MLIFFLWVLAGIWIIYNMKEVINVLSPFAQAIVMIVLTIFAPFICVVDMAEDILQIIFEWDGVEVDSDDDE